MRTIVYSFVASMVLMFSLTVGSFAADEQAGSSPAMSGFLTGQITDAGKVPLANGRVYIYNKAMGPPSAAVYVRVPDYLTDLDENGRFSQELPAGTYYFIARSNTDIVNLGPPVEGQLIYFPMDVKGEIQPFTVAAGKTTNAGVIATAVPRKRSDKKQEQGATVIEGVVADADGKPVAGAVIYAYDKPDIRDKALFVSEKSAQDGKFSLRLGSGGTYYLRVRGDYGGGIPKEGEIIHLDDAKTLVTVTVKTGEKLADLLIQVKHQEERGPMFNGVPK